MKTLIKRAQASSRRLAPILATLRRHRQLLMDKIFDNIRGNQCLLCLKPALARCVCPACLADLPWQDQACKVCALPLPRPAQDAGHELAVCTECQLHPPPWQRAQAVFHYQFPIDRLIAAFKYHHQLALTDLFADLMAARLTTDAATPVIVPVPLHPQRLRQRGYDQTLLLAQALSRRTGMTCAPQLLQRQRDTPMQKALDREARRDNLAGAFGCDATQVMGRHILLVDDVLTTGATLSVLSELLRQAGAESVQALVIARTLPG